METKGYFSEVFPVCACFFTRFPLCIRVTSAAIAFIALYSRYTYVSLFVCL